MINKKTYKKEANDIFKMCNDSISYSFRNPHTRTELKEMICSFELSLKFCDFIIENIKWYQIRKNKYWYLARMKLIEDKMYFYESQNLIITNKAN